MGRVRVVRAFLWFLTLSARLRLLRAPGAERQALVLARRACDWIVDGITVKGA